MSLLELVVNPNPGRKTLPDCCNPETFADVRAFHRTLPGYQPTPLVALPDLAKELGVKGVYIKDESKRFGLNAFKALGASYAIHKLFPDGNVGLSRSPATGWQPRQGQGLVHPPPGRSRGGLHARRNGGQPRGSHPRHRRHRSDRHRPGTTTARWPPPPAYAKEHGGHLVQDTAFEGYEEVPQNITLGYSTMAAEALEELAALGAGEPTHTFLQAGVGSMAGGVAGLPGGDLQKSPRHGRGGGLGVRLRAGIHPPGQAGHHRRPHPDLHGRSQLRHP